MKHQDWQDLIPFFIANSLNEQQRRSFELHLLTCESCRQDLEFWRKVASAVWEETDYSARTTTPIEPSILQSIIERSSDSEPHTSAFPGNPQRLRVVRRFRKSPFSLTMVAGFLLSILFGGFLISLSVRDDAASDQIVAVNTTMQATDGAFGALMIEAVSPTTVPDTNRGILPTPEPSSTYPDRIISTPTPLLPPNSGGGAIIPSVMPTSAPPALALESRPVENLSGVGPYITQTPGLVESGYQLCNLFNPTNVPIDVHSQATAASAIIGSINPGDQYRTLVRSDEGWFQVFLGIGNIGWVPPMNTYLRGSCDPSQFWIPTPTAPAIDSPVSLQQSNNDTTAIIAIPVANLYDSPDEQAAIVEFALKDTQYPILAYYSASNQRWLQLQIPDSRQVWLRGGDATIYMNDQLPPSPTPQT